MNRFALHFCQRQRQRGVVMVIALVFLVIVSLLGIYMFRGLTVQERIAGNTRDKLRAFEAAQSALQYGEWWLAQPNNGDESNIITCSGTTTVSGVGAGMRVCNAELADPTVPRWTVRTDYTPPAMTVASGGGLTIEGDINYHARPGLHIASIGSEAASPNARLFRITAFGYGGNGDTVAVLSSVYRLSPAVDRCKLDPDSCK